MSTRHVLALVLLALGACGCGARQRAQSAPCDVVGSTREAPLHQLYATFGGPLVVVGDLVLRCRCLDPRAEEGRDLSGADEDRELAGAGEDRDLSGADEGRELAGAGEDRDLSGADEDRDLSGAGEGRDLTGDEEGRDLAGAGEGFACRIDPRCPGFRVMITAPFQYFDGSALQPPWGDCVPAAR